MSQVWEPYHYQLLALEHSFNNPYCGVFMGMGLGKTVTALSLANRLIYQECEVDKVLVIAPKLITRTVWKQEAAKWSHLKHLEVSIVWGTGPKERIAALRKKADIYVINCDNVVWLINTFQGRWPFKCVILDESSKFKGHDSKRFKALKLVMPKYIHRLIELTGTPATNGLIDLWAPMYLLDLGERLEKNISGYRDRYFNPDKMEGHITYSYKPKNDAQDKIFERISDICISMKTEDYLDLPPILENVFYVEMDKQVRDLYDKFERDSIMQIFSPNEDGVIEITAVNSAVLRNKLLQFSNGAIYYEDENMKRQVQEIHDLKLQALEELLEEAQGQNVLVAYTYQHDVTRITKKFNQARTMKQPKDIEDWMAGKIELGVIHPASGGHGLNLQSGGHILIWFGLTDNLEHDQQLGARLQRIGQKEPVIQFRIVMRGTFDEDVLKNLDRKSRTQNSLLNALKVRIEKHTGRSTVWRG